MRLKYLLALILAAVMLPSFATRRDVDLKKEGQAALAAGHYEEAYRKWWILAMQGEDREVQESVAMLLFSDKAKYIKTHENKPVIALQYLYRSALNGQVSAMQKMADASQNAKLGLIKDQPAATCWSEAAAGSHPPIDCAAVTRFKNPASRATCDQLAFMEEQFSVKRPSGTALAQRCLANLTFGLMVPGLPPEREYRIATTEYGKYGIEWIVVGDAPQEGDIERMNSFNELMEKKIMQRYGDDIFIKIDKEVVRRTGRKK